MEINERIIKTVAYFDLFDYPLTRGEVWRWLCGREAGDKRDELETVEREIDALLGKGVFKEKNGFIFAADRDGANFTRESRYRFSCRKWRRARRWAEFFSAVPGVEMVGVGNTLSFNNAKDDSDIDFFIVCAPGTIWRTRFFCAFLPMLFGLRPSARSNRDKLCLSFFVTNEELNINVIATPKAVAIPPGDCFARARNDEKPDVYLWYWTRLMIPLAGKIDTVQNFCEINKAAARGVLSRARFWGKILFWIKFFPGNFLKNRQLAHFPVPLKEAAARGDGAVIVSDNIFKLHVNDRRKEVYDRWVKRSEYLMTNV